MNSPPHYKDWKGKLWPTTFSCRALLYEYSFYFPDEFDWQRKMFTPAYYSRRLHSEPSELEVQFSITLGLLQGWCKNFSLKMLWICTRPPQILKNSYGSVITSKLSARTECDLPGNFLLICIKQIQNRKHFAPGNWISEKKCWLCFFRKSSKAAEKWKIKLGSDNILTRISFLS